MSDNESFLARWSRRKRLAPQGLNEPPDPDDPPKSEGAGTGTAPESAPPPGAPEEGPSATNPASNPESLPPVESISAESDIRGFLAAGVRADLTRAALRRAWTADPAIRDFIGLSENSWDFNVEGGVPGFGSLPTEDVRRLLGRLIGQIEAGEPAPLAAETLPARPAGSPAGESGPPAEAPPLARREDQEGAGGGRESREAADAAAQYPVEESESVAYLRQHRHGGALPK